MRSFVQKVFPRRPILGIFLSLAIVAEIGLIVKADGGAPGTPENPTSLKNIGHVNNICIYEYQEDGFCNYFPSCSRTCGLGTRPKKWYHTETISGACGSAGDPMNDPGWPGWTASQTGGTIVWASDITPPPP